MRSSIELVRELPPRRRPILAMTCLRPSNRFAVFAMRFASMAQTSDAQVIRSDEIDSVRIDRVRSELQYSFARARMALELTETRLLAVALLRASLTSGCDAPSDGASSER